MEQANKAASTVCLEAVSGFLTGIAGAEGSSERIAASFAEHLSHLSTAILPESTHATWRSLAQLLRAPANRPIAEAAVRKTLAWPEARITSLVTLAHDLHATLEKIENDRLEDEIRDNIRRHYL